MRLLVILRVEILAEFVNPLMEVQRRMPELEPGPGQNVRWGCFGKESFAKRSEAHVSHSLAD